MTTYLPNYQAELVGVFGHPVSENPTVVMQEAGFRALNLNWRYLTIEVLPKDLGNAMQGLRAMNMKGINLTIPHKVEVLKYLDEVKPDAALMGAVNTVVRVGDKLVGENTDGKGFMRSLTQDAMVDPKGKQVLVLGAGGAARSITVELALAGARQITLVNRYPGEARFWLTSWPQKHPRKLISLNGAEPFPFQAIRTFSSMPRPSVFFRTSMTNRISTMTRSIQRWSCAMLSILR